MAAQESQLVWHRLVQLLFTLKPRVALALGAVLCVAVIFVDFATPAYLNLSFAYAFVILLATWNAGVIAGLAFATIAGVTQAVIVSDASHGNLLALQWTVILLNRWFTFLMVVGLVHPLRRLYDRQQAIARIDWLTGAANRKHFEEVLHAEMSRGTRAGESLTAVYIDCDDFKLINDSFGHIQGDAMLRAVVEAARQNARPSDTVARIGGDEFAILLPQTDAEHAGPVVSRMNAKLLESMAKNRWPMTFSIGVATFSKAGLTPTDVIACADALMYKAKQTGKGRIVCQSFGDDCQPPASHQAVTGA